LLRCQGGARFQRVEDDAVEQSIEAAECFAAALALASFPVEGFACRDVVAGLGDDGDPAEGGVESAVAVAVEPVPMALS
jgi:hypothetical protein